MPTRHLIHRRPTLHGFTLVELLVVVTIIVVLLALLTPALEQAIYQAELVVCAANKHALGVGVTQYASESKRWYPHRQAVHEQYQWPMNISWGNIPAYDDRPKLRPYISLNATLNCPLIAELDIDNSKPSTNTFGTYNMFFGMQYRSVVGGVTTRYKGMLRIGDRWEWDDKPKKYFLTSSLLAMSRYIVIPGTPTFVSGSHPADTYTSVKLQDQFAGTAEIAGLGFNGGYYTFARWDSYAEDRALPDLNALYADLSAVRLDKVDWQDDERMARSPGYSQDGEGNWEAHFEWVPKR